MCFDSINRLHSELFFPDLIFFTQFCVGDFSYVDTSYSTPLCKQSIVYLSILSFRLFPNRESERQPDAHPTSDWFPRALEGLSGGSRGRSCWGYGCPRLQLQTSPDGRWWRSGHRPGALTLGSSPLRASETLLGVPEVKAIFVGV